MHAWPGFELYVPATQGQQTVSTAACNAGAGAKPASHVHDADDSLCLGALAFDAHFVHARAAPLEYEPVAHSTQECDERAPLGAELVPAAQGTHSRRPGDWVYVPGVHSAHGPPGLPAEPALHVHAIADTLRRGAEAWIAHGRQSWRVGEEKVSARHGAHATLRPKTLENVPGAHMAHSVAPLVAENMPMKHRSHTVAAVCNIKVPAAQSEHGAAGLCWNVPGPQDSHDKSDVSASR